MPVSYLFSQSQWSKLLFASSSLTENCLAWLATTRLKIEGPAQNHVSIGQAENIWPDHRP